MSATSSKAVGASAAALGMSSFRNRTGRVNQRLVQSAVAGCPGSLARLWEGHAAIVHAVLLAHVPSREAHALLDEVAGTAARMVVGLEVPAEFAPRLLGIARRLGLERRGRPGSLRGLLFARSNVASDRLLGIIRSLAPDLSEPLVLRLVLGLPGDEIVRLTGFSHERVASALNAGIRCVQIRLGRSA